MWRRSACRLRRRIHSSAGAGLRRVIEDEGDWGFANEWWGAPGNDNENNNNVIFCEYSEKGNGVVSVESYPSSTPRASCWPRTEKWLRKSYASVHGSSEQFQVLRYSWRSLRFNGHTRQSTVKVMTARIQSQPHSIFDMQLPDCLATPYLKSMASAGLAAIASSKYHLASAVHGDTPMRILCVGHGGGSLPLFLASKIKGALVDIVEIDPHVTLASTRAMGFPSFALMRSPGERFEPQPDPIDQAIWKGIHERLFLYNIDAEDFILGTQSLYDMVFIDAYDGEDIFPVKLWDPQSPFLAALGKRLHPDYGTVVVNLHSDFDISNHDRSLPTESQQVLPMGKYVARVCRAYKNMLVGNIDSHSPVSNRDSGVGFTVAVPELCNSSLVVSRGFGISSQSLSRDLVLNTLAFRSFELETLLNLPFHCLQYLKTGFVMIN